jgi:hypothetical protein
LVKARSLQQSASFDSLRHRHVSETHMADHNLEASRHPVGTLVIVGIYGLLFVLGWLALYFYVYLSRGPVTS